MSAACLVTNITSMLEHYLLHDRQAQAHVVLAGLAGYIRVEYSWSQIRGHWHAIVDDAQTRDAAKEVGREADIALVDSLPKTRSASQRKTRLNGHVRKIR